MEYSALLKASKDLKMGKERKVEALGSNMLSGKVHDLNRGSKRKEAFVADPINSHQILKVA